MGKGAASAGLRSAHAKSIKGLAWASFVGALADGALLPGTVVGDAVDAVLGWLPYGDLFPWLILIIGWGLVFLDAWNDLEPNMGAVVGALLLPSVASSMTGGLAEWTQDIAGTVLDAIDQWIKAGQPAGIGGDAFAIGLGLAVLLVAQRVVKKSRKG